MVCTYQEEEVCSKDIDEYRASRHPTEIEEAREYRGNDTASQTNRTGGKLLIVIDSPDKLVTSVPYQFDPTSTATSYIQQITTQFDDAKLKYNHCHRFEE